MTASSASRSTIITVVAIYTLVRAILSLCGALALLGIGAIAGIGSAAVNQAIQESGGTSADAAAAAAAASTLGGVATVLLSIIGIVILVVAIALLVDAVGLFQGKPWSWMLTLVLYGVGVVLTLVQWVLSRNSFSPLGLVLLIIDAVIIYLFYTNADVKRSLGKA
jgi:hypothetical protein